MEIIKITTMDFSSKDYFLNLADQFFGHIGSTNVHDTLSNVNFDISLKATLDDEVVGFYLLSDKSNLIEEIKKESASIFFKEDEYLGKKSLEGCAMGVIEAYRSRGIGQMLIDSSISLAKKNGYDFIFGQHHKDLNNIKYWLARRKLIAESKNVYFTLKDVI
ncbi:MAG: GNAT family N-acetyltransferase [Saprospiraceae bacterium]|nr:GNAT family N-acetyltransferase [Saprospiraceae bacterium]